MIKRAQWEQQRRQRAIDRPPEQLKQAAVAMDALTRSPEWNAFLQTVQADQERDAQALQGVTDVLRSMAYLDVPQLQALRHEAIVLQARIEARESVIALPRKILEAAQG